MFKFLVKEIRSKEGRLHFRRWRLFSCPYFNIYIHKLYRSDQDKYPHNHPWHFISIILWGGYYEYTDAIKTGLRIRHPGSIVFHNAKNFHHIRLYNMKFSKCRLNMQPSISIVITGPKINKWGYKHPNGFIDHKVYRQMKTNRLLD